MTDNQVAADVDGERGAASRRSVIAGLAGAGLGVPLLAACGSDGGSGSGGSSSGGSGSGSTSSGGAIAKKSDIPVGGGRIFPAEKVVVTQPTAGEFKAFSAVCTHQGCVVSEIKGDEIDCACHGSRFSIEDGSPQGGPANSPLEEFKVTASGEDLTVS